MSDSGERIAARRRAFGRRLRAVREEKGMSQAAVAKAARIDRSFYSEVETGRHSVSVDRLHDIADVLGVAVADLFPPDPEPTGLPEPTSAASGCEDRGR